MQVGQKTRETLFTVVDGWVMRTNMPLGETIVQLQDLNKWSKITNSYQTWNCYIYQSIGATIPETLSNNFSLLQLCHHITWWHNLSGTTSLPNKGRAKVCLLLSLWYLQIIILEIDYSQDCSTYPIQSNNKHKKFIQQWTMNQHFELMRIWSNSITRT